MKTYKGQELYDEMEKVPFLDRNFSFQEADDNEIKKAISYLKRKSRANSEAVIVPWLSHKGLNIVIFGYTFSTKNYANDLKRLVEEDKISGDPLPGHSYDISRLEKICKSKKAVIR